MSDNLGWYWSPSREQIVPSRCFPHLSFTSSWLPGQFATGFENAMVMMNDINDGNGRITAIRGIDRRYGVGALLPAGRLQSLYGDDENMVDPLLRDELQHVNGVPKEIVDDISNPTVKEPARVRYARLQESNIYNDFCSLGMTRKLAQQLVQDETASMKEPGARGDALRGNILATCSPITPTKERLLVSVGGRLMDDVCVYALPQPTGANVHDLFDRSTGVRRVDAKCVGQSIAQVAISRHMGTCPADNENGPADRLLIAARGSYVVRFFQLSGSNLEERLGRKRYVSKQKALPQCDLSSVGCLQLECRAAAVDWNPSFAGESFVVSERGGVYAWRLDCNNPTVVREPRSAGQGEWHGLARAHHPRTFLCGDASSLTLLDMRCSSGGLLLYRSKPLERLGALSAGSTPSQLSMLTTSTAVMVIDSRMPGNVVASCPHLLDLNGPPHLMHVAEAPLNFYGRGDSVLVGSHDGSRSSSHIALHEFSSGGMVSLSTRDKNAGTKMALPPRWNDTPYHLPNYTSHHYPAPLGGCCSYFVPREVEGGGFVIVQETQLGSVAAQAFGVETVSNATDDDNYRSCTLRSTIHDTIPCPFDTVSWMVDLKYKEKSCISSDIELNNGDIGGGAKAEKVNKRFNTVDHCTVPVTRQRDRIFHWNSEDTPVEPPPPPIEPLLNIVNRVSDNVIADENTTNSTSQQDRTTTSILLKLWNDDLGSNEAAARAAIEILVLEEEKKKAEIAAKRAAVAAQAAREREEELALAELTGGALDVKAERVSQRSVKRIRRSKGRRHDGF